VGRIGGRLSVELAAILGLAGLLFVKEAGVPVPIPGDLLVLGAGVATAGDPGQAVTALVAILVAGYLGGSLQFLLVRGTLRRAVIGVLARFGVARGRIDALAERLRRRGARGVAVARVTPGLRVPAIVASGLAALPLPAFVVGLIVGNTLFVAAHFLLGFAVGAPAIALVQGAGFTIAVILLAVLAVVGVVGWRLIRRREGLGAPAGAFQRSAQASGASPHPARRIDTFSNWADAACPACLALAVLRVDVSVDDASIAPVR
jgi:membrane protein DedA with SNARE-associated domain